MGVCEIEIELYIPEVAGGFLLSVHCSTEYVYAASV